MLGDDKQQRYECVHDYPSADDDYAATTRGLEY